ncbi:hypothetical protein D9M69_551370 [compost metagenome]
MAAIRLLLFSMAAIASCRPNGQPSVMSCRCTQPSGSMREPKRPASIATVSSTRKRRVSAAMATYSPRASKSATCSLSRLREAMITRRLAGALCRR